MTRLANITARQKSTRTQTLLFAAFLGLATFVSASSVGTIAMQVAQR
jgi:hypothetical protein